VALWLITLETKSLQSLRKLCAVRAGIRPAKGRFAMFLADGRVLVFKDRTVRHVITSDVMMLRLAERDGYAGRMASGLARFFRFPDQRDGPRRWLSPRRTRLGVHRQTPAGPLSRPKFVAPMFAVAAVHRHTFRHCVSIIDIMAAAFPLWGQP
jgi:hypothetical protein